MRHEKTLLIRPEFLNHGGTLFGGYMMLPSGRLSFHARVVRADKSTADRTDADRLGCANGIGSLEFMAAFLQFAQRVFTNPLFDNQFVRFPLMMKARLGQCRRRVHSKINRVDDRQDRLTDDGWPARRADGEDRFAILKNNRRAHARERTFA